MPARDGLASPVWTSRNAPVPYVHFASPASRQPWPKSAACWSPATPVIGTPAGKGPTRAVVPNRPEEASDLRQDPARHAEEREQSVAASRRRRRSYRSVREALVGSVAWTAPARQPPEDPRVDRPERDLPAGGTPTQAPHVVEEPPRPSSPRSTGRGPAPSTGAPPPRGRAAAAPRRRARSGGPATRSPARRGARSRGPTGPTVSRWFVMPDGARRRSRGGPRRAGPGRTCEARRRRCPRRRARPSPGRG